MKIKNLINDSVDVKCIDPKNKYCIHFVVYFKHKNYKKKKNVRISEIPFTFMLN